MVNPGPAGSMRKLVEKRLVRVKKPLHGRQVSLKSALNQNKELAEPPEVRKS